MKCAIEDDDARPAGRVTCDLDGVFNSFCPAVEQRHRLLKGTWGKTGQLLTDLNIWFIGNRGKVRVQEVVSLILDRGDNARV